MTPPAASPPSPPPPPPPGLLRRLADRRTRRAQALQHVERATRQQETALRAEARHQGRSAVRRTGGVGAPVDPATGLPAPLRAELASWAAVRVGHARGGGLPPAPVQHEALRTLAGLVLGAAVLFGLLGSAEWLWNRDHRDVGALLALVGLAGGPGTFLALVLPALVDQRVRHWSRELAAEALRAAHAEVLARRDESRRTAAAGASASDDGGVMPR
jgi:hypothetical protein